MSDYAINATRLPPTGTWALAGVTGAIPARATIYSTVSADNTGATDVRATIQTQLDACTPGQAVLLPAGTYRVNAALTLATAITLRGAVDANGAPTTIIKGYETAGGTSCVRGGNAGIESYAVEGVTINSGYTKGSTVIVVASATSFAAGKFMLIDQTNGTGDDGLFVTNVGGEALGGANVSRQNGTKALRQVVRITNVASTTITFTPSLLHALSSGLSPQASVINATITSGFGLENLQLEDAGTNAGDADRGTVLFSNCYDCYLNNVKTVNCWTEHIFWENTINCAIVHCYFTGSSDGFIQNHGYGLRFGESNHYNLIYDCIFGDLTGRLIMEWGSSGNVAAYNFFTNSHHGLPASPNAAFPDLQPAHGAHPMYNLFEGNICRIAESDDPFGSSSHNTFYRNRIYGTKGSAYQLLWCCGVWADQTYMNYVGNVLGDNSVAQIYERAWLTTTTQTYNYDSDWLIYRFGYTDATPNLPSLLIGKTNARDTVLRVGNYNTVDDAIPAAETLAGSTLAPSLYLAVAPTGWPTSLAWPIVDPILTPTADPMNNARYRYENGRDAPNSGGSGSAVSGRVSLSGNGKLA